MKQKMAGVLGALALSFMLLGTSASPVFADLKLCNQTGSRVGVAIG